ncbi:MAG: MmcQ/YjbR family DNA-binding protein [Zoogloea sp.]|nr:MAG: MmcQ/YjbR family DNA-binding protein [Zoogloea sp.]
MTPAQVAAFCRTLPGASESIKWGSNRVFSITGNKMFAILDFVDKGKGGLAFKVDDDLFLGYTDRPGIRPAPYLARARWVTMESPYPLGEAELRAALARSHQLVALRLPKYRQAEFLALPEK